MGKFNIKRFFSERKEMPQLKEAVSKFEMRPELQKQESLVTTVLKWMQDNPAQVKNTTFARMARTMALGPGVYKKADDILATMYNMSHEGYITYNGNSGSRRKTFFINYLHKNMPKSVIERAPSRDIKNAKTVAGIVTESLGDEPTEEPKPEVEKPVEPTEKYDYGVKAENPVPVPSVDVPIEVEKMPNGNFTLQLNINFTINGKR